MSGIRHKPNKASIAELWHDGMSLVNIGKELGISKGLVLYHTTQMGLRRDRVKIDDGRFAEMWMAGDAYSKIKAELDIPNGSMTSHAKRLGLPLRRSAEWRAICNAKGGTGRIDRKEMQKLHEAGKKAAHIAATLKISKGHCHKLLREMNSPVPIAADEPVKAVPVMPPHPFWTPERDQLVLATNGHHANLAALAQDLARPITFVQQRWHRVGAL